MKIFGKVVATGFELGLVWLLGGLTASALEQYLNISKEKEELDIKYAATCAELEKANMHNASLRKQVSTLQSRFDRARNLIG